MSGSSGLSGYLRNQTFHYGGKTNWQDVRWAIRAVTAEEGVVSRANDTYSGTRLDFAELIWVQHLTRKFPATEPDADDEARQELEELQLRTLVQAPTTAISAGIRFAMAALGAYLNDLPEGVVVWES